MNTETGIETAIRNLIQKTQEKKIEWSYSENSDELNLLPIEEGSDFFFSGIYNGKRFRLYEVFEKFYTSIDEFVWTKNVRLELITKTVPWRFPDSLLTRTLYDTVVYQYNDVDNALKELM